MRLVWFLFFLFFLNVIKAQKINPLTIGDEIPNITLNVGKDEFTKVSFKDYKGKLVILDFWGIHCSSCIEHMPEMEHFQEEFGNKIQILLVTKDSKGDIDQLAKRIARLRNTKLPMIVADTILSKLFPNNSLPYHIWIDASGIVVQKTNGYNTTDESIRDFLSGRKVDLPIKNEKIDFDITKPLWEGSNVDQMKHLEYFSLITGRLDIYSGGGFSKKDSVTKQIVWFRRYNSTILDLYKVAMRNIPTFSKIPVEDKNRWVFEIQNPKILENIDFPQNKPPSYLNEWANRNYHSYEIKIPPNKSLDVFKMMLQDLDRFFGLHTVIEKRKIRCLALKRNSTKDLIKSKGGESEDVYNDVKAGELPYYRIRNIPFKQFFLSLAYVNQNLITPIIDETGYKGNMDIEIQCELKADSKNISILRGQLKKFGLDLVEEYRTIDMVVLRDNKQ